MGGWVVSPAEQSSNFTVMERKGRSSKKASLVRKYIPVLSLSRFTKTLFLNTVWSQDDLHENHLKGVEWNRRNGV